jgi:ribosomal protein L30/L7E
MKLLLNCSRGQLRLAKINHLVFGSDCQIVLLEFLGINKINTTLVLLLVCKTAGMDLLKFGFEVLQFRAKFQELSRMNLINTTAPVIVH